MEGVFGKNKNKIEKRKRMQKGESDALAAPLIKKLCTGALDGC